MASRAGLRVAVVTTDLSRTANLLWEAVAERVDDVVLLGSKRTVMSDALGVESMALRETDFGKGLIWRHLSGLVPALRRFRPDLVHVNGELWGITVQEVLTSRLPVAVHGAENLWSHGSSAERVLRRVLVQRAARRMCGYASWNHSGADHVAGLVGSPTFPTVVLPAILPPAEFRSARWEGTEGNAAPRILLVGRAVREKGFGTVLEAVSRLPEYLRPTVRLCGSGSALADLQAAAGRLGVAMEHLGDVSPTRLASEMREATLLVQPSLTTDSWAEQFGRSVAEAMTVGLPCVVSDSGELPRLVAYDPSAVFPERRPDRLAALMTSLLADPAKRESLARRQTRLADRFGPTAATDSMVDFWHRCREHRS